MANKKAMPFDRTSVILLSVVALLCFFWGIIVCCFYHVQERTGHSESSLKDNLDDTLFVHQEGPSKENPDIFFSVKGRTLGNLLPNATVFLYSVPSTNFSVVMATIENQTPFRETMVDAGNTFQIGCVSLGNYAFVIPASSYDGSVGFPLPYEWIQNNYTLDVAFQGGDYRYSVGAFSIRAVREESSI
jgi:hypothetical protein